MRSFDSWNDELYHYGVLGMKWGIRRYQNEDGSLTKAGERRYQKTGEYGYVYKSHATKKYDRKALKAERRGDTAKAEKYKQRAEISRQIDKNEENYARSVKAGGNIITRLLTGEGIGGKNYQLHLAMGSKQTELGSKFVAAMLSKFSGRLRKAMVIRSNEDSTLGRLGRNMGGNNFNYANKNLYNDDVISAVKKELNKHNS